MHNKCILTRKLCFFTQIRTSSAPLMIDLINVRVNYDLLLYSDIFHCNDEVVKQRVVSVGTSQECFVHI